MCSLQVWYPNSALKTAHAIEEFDREALPLIILANWRGFSGGQRDLFDGILQVPQPGLKAWSAHGHYGCMDESHCLRVQTVILMLACQLCQTYYLQNLPSRTSSVCGTVCGCIWFMTKHISHRAVYCCLSHAEGASC